MPYVIAVFRKQGRTLVDRLCDEFKQFQKLRGSVTKVKKDVT